MEITTAPWSFILPIIIPVVRVFWVYRKSKSSKLPNNFILDLLWRIFAFGGGIAYIYSGVLKNLPALNIDFYLTPAPLSIIGALYIVNYSWTNLGQYLDSSFRQPEEISKSQKHSE